MFSKDDKFIILPLIICFFWATVNWAVIPPDAYGYILIANHFIDSSLILPTGALFRLQRPLIPFIAGLISFFLRFEILPIWFWNLSEDRMNYLSSPEILGIVNAFALISLFSTLLTVIILYKYIERHFDRTTAVIGTMIFSCSFPVIAFSSAIFLDPTGNLMAIVLVYSIEKLNIKRKFPKDISYLVLVTLLIIISTLVREQLLFIAVFLVCVQLIEKMRYRVQRGNYLIQYSGIIICSIIIISIIYFLVGTSWFAIVEENSKREIWYTSGTWGPLYYIGTIFIAFNAIVIFVAIMGFFADENHIRRIHFIIIAIPFVLFSLVAFHMEARLSFFLYPVIYPYVAKGILFVSNSSANLVLTQKRTISFSKILHFFNVLITSIICLSLIFSMIHIRFSLNNPLLMSEYPPSAPEPILAPENTTINIPVVVQRLIRMTIYLTIITLIILGVIFIRKRIILYKEVNIENNSLGHRNRSKSDEN